MPIKVRSPIIDYFGFEKPFRCGLFGSSRVGKTTMIYNLLEKQMFDSDFSIIYYCYPSLYQNKLDWHEKLNYVIEFLDYIPNKDFFDNIEENSLVIIDDCWYTSTQTEAIRDLFKVLSGKKNVSVFITSQNPFEGGTHARTIRNNLNHFILFKNLGDYQINRKLCQQLGMLSRYDKAAIVLDKRYESIWINLDVTLKNEELRLSTNIFDLPIVYA